MRQENEVINILRSFTITILLLVVCIGLVACRQTKPKNTEDIIEHYRDSPDYFESGYFECIKKNNKVIICGLTQAGMELEELVIPRMIDGLEVEQLGWTTPLG
ncbi:MAG: hypothetical protein LBU04_03485, partial [Christensenellaceae bacterium]|nr:hypothetical protein [Christensenellaceae bacterium]